MNIRPYSSDPQSFPFKEPYCQTDLCLWAVQCGLYTRKEQPNCYLLAGTPEQNL